MVENHNFRDVTITKKGRSIFDEFVAFQFSRRLLKAMGPPIDVCKPDHSSGTSRVSSFVVTVRIYCYSSRLR